MKNYAERLTSELLHTPRAHWPPIIRKRVFEAQGRSFCSYCGKVTDFSGMTTEQVNASLLEHILTCEKRPELKMLKVCVAAADAVEAFGVATSFAVGSTTAFGCAMAKLKIELDRLKTTGTGLESLEKATNERRCGRCGRCSRHTLRPRPRRLRRSRPAVGGPWRVHAGS
jgi:hypothetical protein